MLLSTVKYLNDNIIPGIAGIIVVGLLFRMALKLNSIFKEDDGMKTAINVAKKYIKLAVITVSLSSLIYLIQSYFE